MRDPSTIHNLILLPLLSFIFLTHLLDNPATCQDAAYQPVENIALACGLLISPSEPAYGRNWVPDVTNPELFTFTESSTANKSTSSTASQPPAQDLVPYLTARVSHSEFTYCFHVSPGPKFIRLHFYPTATYPGFESCPSLFSVSTSNFTLLNNFTGKPWNRDWESDVYVKEFIVNVGDYDEYLNVTFTPSLVIPDAYAFVNGIELVSMPSSLYYPEKPMSLVDTPGSLYSLTKDTALELMFRINVGGGPVLPEEDTGMFRTWDSEGNHADNNLFPGATSMNKSFALEFTSNAKNYTAPGEVYRTAQLMGNSQRINLTWNFVVDSGFTYVVRLHFCQLFAQHGPQTSQVFSIYVATFLAESFADLALWSGGGIGVPLYKDYPVVLGRAQQTDKVNLSVQLHPSAATFTEDPDAILNGIEILKASNQRDLAGIRFYSLQSNPSSSNNTAGSGNKNFFHYDFVGGMASGIIVLCPLAVAVIIRFRKMKAASNSKHNHNFLSSTGACRRFSLSQIKAATSNFDKESIIGHGGFGNVYKGLIDNSATAVAIKRLKQGSDQGANEFRMEIEMLSQLRYLHLVSLIGYCDRNKEMILVYDYMSRGTLRDHLYGTVNPPLPWERRLRICIGTARGLQYLHSGVKCMIIHRDVKSTNILLDEKWVAKVSDFGLSKVGSSSSSITHVSTMVKGSFGYLDPEYYHLQHLTQKSDVYSFGVVLCEVLCARPAIIRSEVDDPVNLAMLFRASYRRGSLDEIIDPHLVGKIVPECLKKYAEIAFQCIAENGANRPLMGDVVWGLELALQLQDPAANEQMRSRNSCSSQGEEQSEAEVELEESEAEENILWVNGKITIASR